MKKLFILLLFIPHLLIAQNYRELTDSALHVMWSANDTNVLKVYPLSLALYQRAFKEYPNEIEWVALYKAGSIECELGNKTEAFDYLGKTIDKDGWTVILGKYSRGEFSKLVDDPRWDLLVDKARKRKQDFLRPYALKQEKLEEDQMLKKMNFDRDDAISAYEKIKTYHQYPVIHDRYISMGFLINDSTRTTYLICLPPNYDSHRSYALMFSLHGAVSMNTGFPDYEDSTSTGGWNRFYTKYAGEVIMVYPHGNKEYNWMYPDAGFFMIPAILKQIKQIINVDDNRVFITGHSNGATGSFSYLMKEPSPFAAFYGFNTRPRVATGGTYIRNILNRSFFNVSTDIDYYYPPNANDSLAVTMKKLGADYQDHRYNGFPHWFPQFDQSEPAHKLLFEDLAKRKRDAFHPVIYWECDNVKYGRCDWIEITALDTLKKRANWQTNINFKINKWIVLSKKDSAVVRDTLLDAFNYRHQSGAIKAVYSNNVFKIETSDVKSFSLLISPEMVDMNKPLTVTVNGKVYSKQKPNYNKDFMLADFKNTLDRSAIWVNHIDVTVP